MISLLRRCLVSARFISRYSTLFPGVKGGGYFGVLAVRTFNQSEQSISTSGSFGPLSTNSSNTGRPEQTEDVDAEQTIEKLESRYSADVFLSDNKSGGHVIYSSEDALNPLQSEIRFSADAVPYYFPYVWLRDHCKCPVCAGPDGHSRVTAEEVAHDIVPVLDETTNRGTSVGILWKDGHVSRYPSRWLWANRFGHETPKDVVDERNAVRWDAKQIKESLQRFDFRSLIESDEILFDWLMALQMHGLAVIQDVPETPEQLHVLGDRVGLLRRCHFGLSFEETIRDDDGGLAFHTDLPYMSSPPGISLTLLIGEQDRSESGGALLLLSDGFHASDVFSGEQRESCKILSEVDWEYASRGASARGEVLHRAKHPTIKFDNQNRVSRVVFNDRQRGPKLNVSAEHVPPAYQSLKQYLSILQRPENAFRYTMNPGEILSRDNRRVVYKWAPVGRAQRKTEGAYIDWDEVTSKLRVLYKRFTAAP